MVVVIDQQSLDYFSNNRVSWPWPRDFYAHLVNICEDAEAELIIFDMLFR